MSEFAFALPDIGEGLVEATIDEWLVAPGEPVVVDQAIVVVETDKATTELPSPVAGVLASHGAPEGATIAVGETLATIATTDDAPLVGTLDDASAPLGAERPRAYPAVRRLAHDLGVDLGAITGTGPSGRITRDDVLAAGDTGASLLSPTRRAIASNLTESWRTIPHVTAFDFARAEALLDLAEAEAVPVDAVLIAVARRVLGEFPDFNATLEGDRLTHHRRMLIGVAVDTPAGLVVPHLDMTEPQPLDAVAAELRALVEAARARKLSRSELTGQTFTVSNIGASGGWLGTPIVPPKTTAILSVGQARAEAVVENGAVLAGMRLPLSLSYDHRIIDGGAGRRFLRAVIDAIEQPAST